MAPGRLIRKRVPKRGGSMVRRLLHFAAIACVFDLALLGLTACKGSVSAAESPQASEMSGPPVPNAQYAARNPRTCAKVTSPPTVEQARALVQCGIEGMFPGPSLVLVTDVTLQMGKVRPQTALDGIDGLDPTSPI